MSKKVLLQEIRKKFKNYTRFAELAKVDRYKLQLFIQRETDDSAECARLAELCANTSNVSTKNEVTPIQILRLRKALKRASGVTAFCRANPEFKEDMIFRVLRGSSRLKSKKVRELFKVLKVK
jgi:hypothetical protein